MINRVAQEEQLSKLVDALIQKQEQLQVTNREFSKRAGMSRAMWYLVKSGRREPGRDILKAICRAFPELKTIVVQEITDESN